MTLFDISIGAKILSNISVRPIEKFRRLVEHTRLLSYFIIRATKTIPQIHTQRSLQHWLGKLRVYQFSPAIRVVISVTLMIIGTLSLLVIREDRETPYSQLPSSEIASKTRDQLRALSEKHDVHNSGNDLIVSSWIRDNGFLYQLSTTDERTTRVSFPDDQKSIIGCAFANPNHIVRRDDEISEVVVSSRTGDPSPIGDRCEFRVTEHREIASIICNSYNPTTNPEYTVGLCVSTEGKQDVTANGSLEVVRKGTQDFYRTVIPWLQNKRTTLLPKLDSGAQRILPVSFYRHASQLSFSIPLAQLHS